MGKDGVRVLACCLCSFWLTGVIAMCFLSFIMARTEREKIDTYLQTDCRVTHSSFEKCGVTRAKSGEQHCVRLKWQIEYIQYQSDKQTTIIRQESYLKHWRPEPDVEIQRDLGSHRIGQTYLCYHSPTNRLTEVQWEKPSVKNYTLLMIAGIGLLLVSMIMSLFIIYTVSKVCCGYDCPRRIPQCCRVSRTNHDRRRNTVRRRDQHAHLNRSQVNRPPTIRLEEENIPLTPSPPPYVASDDFIENESIPSPPPPPYVPSSASIENENIPSTPPPAYVRSSSV